MGKGRAIRCYEYVNHPYEKVRDALSGDAVAVFVEATQSATARVRDVAAELHVQIGGVEVGAEISLVVDKIEEQPSKITAPPTTRLQLQWQAVKSPGLFPFMQAELAIYPLTGKETQLDFSGQYEPPLGALGSAIDAVLAHRLAEASVHHFLKDIAAYLRAELAG